MKVLVLCLVTVSVLGVSHPAAAALTHCEGFTRNELNALAPTPRIAWLTEELARCDLDSQRQAELYLARGTAWLAEADPRRAIADFDKAVQLKPGYTDVFINRAVAFTDLEEYEKAVADYDWALELDPNYALTHNGLAWTLYESGRDLERALRHSERALALEPEFWGWHDTHGHLLAALGRPEAAMAAFERALTLADSATVRLYQEELAEKRLDPGPPDGLYGPRTRQAIRACVEMRCNIWAH